MTTPHTMRCAGGGGHTLTGSRPAGEAVQAAVRQALYEGRYRGPAAAAREEALLNPADPYQLDAEPRAAAEQQADATITALAGPDWYEEGGVVYSAEGVPNGWATSTLRELRGGAR